MSGIRSLVISIMLVSGIMVLAFVNGERMNVESAKTLSEITVPDRP